MLWYNKHSALEKASYFLKGFLTVKHFLFCFIMQRCYTHKVKIEVLHNVMLKIKMKYEHSTYKTLASDGARILLVI